MTPNQGIKFGHFEELGKKTKRSDTMVSEYIDGTISKLYKWFIKDIFGFCAIYFMTAL